MTLNVKTLMLNDLCYPEVLKHIPSPPKSLFLKGRPLEDYSEPLLAIVGSRKVDDYGRYVTSHLTRQAAEFGFTIVSGLAFGVDSIAHETAVSAGGRTIAVLPSGIESIYPRMHSKLASKILEKGTLLSERSGIYNPQPFDFLRRNRLISGLSQGVLITQAAQRSGSLNTARHALEQGRLVMAVPGPITNPLCEGTNNLLKAGAIPVTCVEDIVAALGYSLKQVAAVELLAENDGERAIIELLKDGVTDADLIVRRIGLSASECNVHLTMLELRGIISPLGANHWTLKRT